MQRFRLSSNTIQFTAMSEPMLTSDYDTDNPVEQQSTSNSEVIRIGNLLDQVAEYIFCEKKIYTFIS